MRWALPAPLMRCGSRQRVLTFACLQGNPRTTVLLAVAKENSLDLEWVETVPSKGVATEYLKLNKLGKVPTFEGADGYVLTECIAIAVYCEWAHLPHARIRG